MKVIPQSAALYRAAVRDLNSTLHDPTERAEARALIAELLGRQVRIRQDGAAVFARLEIDEAVLLASAAKSLEIKDFQVGSGGLLWTHIRQSSSHDAATCRSCPSQEERASSSARPRHDHPWPAGIGRGL